MCMPMPHVKRISCILMQFICLQMFKVYSAWPSQTLRAVRGEPPLQQPCLPSGSNALRIRTVASQGIGPKRCHKRHREQDQHGVCYRVCHRFATGCCACRYGVYVGSLLITSQKMPQLEVARMLRGFSCRALHQVVDFP